MRNISWFILGIGSALILGTTASFAQDAPRPPVQVVIGPNGVKVIDPKTGKEVPSVVTKIANAPARIVVELELDKKQKTPGVFEIEFDLQLEQAHKELLRAIQLQKAKEGPKVDKVEIKPMEFKLVPGPDGKAIIVVMQRKAEPLSTDKKIDLLLKQVADLRQDVDAIKKKLDIKPTVSGWEGYYRKDDKGPPRGWGGWGYTPQGPDKKLDKEMLDRLQKLLKELEGEAKKADKGPDKKKEAGKGPDKKQPANPDAEIERRLERILQEAEELRREIRNLQTPPKKK
jgi:hypothetical protein